MVNRRPQARRLNSNVMPEQKLIFGQPIPRGLKQSKKKGFAWVPGTGPTGQTCKTCRHSVGVRYSKIFYKCALVRKLWTNSYGTDILLKSPACKYWEKKEAQ